MRACSSCAGSACRSQAEALATTGAHGTLHWFYLDVSVDAQQVVQRLNVVSEVPVGGDGPVWLDVTSSAPGQLAAASVAVSLSAGRFVAAGLIGFLHACLTLQVAADGGWTIDVDNNKQDGIDFVVQAAPDEVRTLMSGLCIQVHCTNARGLRLARYRQAEGLPICPSN